jgi:hypothetical protein
VREKYKSFFQINILDSINIDMGSYVQQKTKWVILSLESNYGPMGLCNKSITTDATAGAGILYPSGAPELASGFYLFLWGSYCSSCILAFIGQCCDLRCAFRVKALFGSSLRDFMFYLCICIYLRILVSNMITKGVIRNS